MWTTTWLILDKSPPPLQKTSSLLLWRPQGSSQRALQCDMPNTPNPSPKQFPRSSKRIVSFHSHTEKKTDVGFVLANCLEEHPKWIRIKNGSTLSLISSGKFASLSWALSTRVKQSSVFYRNVAYWSLSQFDPGKTDHNPEQKRALLLTTLGFIKSKIEPLNSHHYWNSSLRCL